MWAQALPALITAAVTSFVVTALVAVWGPVDRPDQRRNHKAPTPTAAGLGIIVGTGLGAACLHRSDASEGTEGTAEGARGAAGASGSTASDAAGAILLWPAGRIPTPVR